MDDDILDCARHAEDAIRRLVRITVDRPSLTLADIVTARLAEAVAEPPQAATQLSDMLQNAVSDWHLTMDSMSATSDPSIAIDTARLHLDAAHQPVVEVYRHLDVAHQDIAHIAAEDLWNPGVPELPRAAHRPQYRPPPPISRPPGPGPSR